MILPSCDNVTPPTGPSLVLPCCGDEAVQGALGEMANRTSLGENIRGGKVEGEAKARC